LEEAREAKTAEEANKRRAIANDQAAKQDMMPELKEKSRQEYLRKREQQKVEQMRAMILEEQRLFRGEKLTERERKSLEEKKRLLALAEERMNLTAEVDYYHMPDDYIDEKGKLDKKKQADVLTARYVPEDDKAFVADADIWEQKQLDKSLLKFGALDKVRTHIVCPNTEKKKNKKKSKEYEYVFDNQVEFELAQQMAGDDMKTAPQMSEAEKKKLDIQEVRRSLPTYAFRDGLLEAVEKYQVCRLLSWQTIHLI